MLKKVISMENEKILKSTFDDLVEKWSLERKELPPTWGGARAHTKTESYNKIIALGEHVLPFIVEKLKAGNFYFNRAYVEILNLAEDAIMAPKIIYSEQDLSQQLVLHWEAAK